MPDFVFNGHAPGMYPMLRDVHGQPAGTVTPGDVREFGEAPDQDWAPCEDAPAPPAKAPRQPGKTGHDDDTAGQSGSEEN